jgi:GNAT superfamily N-acetyltransferase
MFDAGLGLRKATVMDLPLLNQLYAEMDSDLAGNHAPLLAEEVIAEVWQQMQLLPDYHIYLLEQEAQVVGTFSLLLLPTMMHRGFHRSALLDSVMVRASFRSQGIGKAMMQQALEIAREAGCYKVMLSSNLVRERAHQFYESLGFKQHGWSFSLKL